MGVAKRQVVPVDFYVTSMVEESAGPKNAAAVLKFGYVARPIGLPAAAGGWPALLHTHEQHVEKSG